MPAFSDLTWRLLVVVGLVLSPATRADEVLVAARAQSEAPHYDAYGVVEPIRTVMLTAAADGVLSGLHAVPGSLVHSGEELARLSGPERHAALESAQAAVDSAAAAAKLAQTTLHSTRRLYPGFKTRAQLVAARAALSEARAHTAAARTRLAALQREGKVISPVDGEVLSVHVADGQRVAVGAPLLRIEPRDELWLRAVYYGQDARALHLGMEGTFQPADGGPARSVILRRIIDPVRPDGGRAVACLPAAPGPAWHSGEAGTLRLAGQVRRWAAVPSQALIMDQGRWWVLVHGDHGDERRAVRPGPSAGDWTLIDGGLAPGERVVAADAYLRFHQDFAHHYQPPD